MTAKTVRSVSMQELAPAIVQAIQTGGSAELTVTGRSMTPFLRDRVSRVRLTAISQPKRGDVVLYRRQNGEYVLHRIAACCGDGTYVMCGDAQTVLEPSIRRDQLIAREKTAKAQAQVTDALGSINILDPTSELGRFEDRVRRQEALAQGKAELAASSLDAQFAELETDSSQLEIEARLAALKGKSEE